MIRQLFILLIMLAWSIALLATILPAFPHTHADFAPNYLCMGYNIFHDLKVLL